MIEQIHLYIFKNITKSPKILVCYLKKKLVVNKIEDFEN